MKVAIVGSGAIGLYYGALLQRSGHEVAFLMRSGLELAKQRGIRVIEPDSSFSLDPVAAFGDTREIGICDLVVISAKATANHLLASWLPPLLGPETRLLTLQNGLGNDRLLAELFPSNRVFGGLCFVCLNRVEPAVVQAFMKGSVTIGPRDARDAEAAREIAAAFSQAGVRTKSELNLPLVQWKKLVWNVPFNGLAIAAGGVCTDAILASAELRREARALMEEIIGAAEALGYSFSADLVDRQISQTEPMGAYRPSSMIDYVEGRPVEVEAIWGEPLRQGQALGLPMPKLEMLYALLKAICKPA